MTETFIISNQPASRQKILPEEQSATFDYTWHLVYMGLVVTTLFSQDARLRLVFLPSRRKWVWSLAGATDPHDPKWAGIAAETLVFIARMLPVHTSATETLEAYFASDDTLRIDVVDASIGSCLTTFASWEHLDRFAISRSNARRLN